MPPPSIGDAILCWGSIAKCTENGPTMALSAGDWVEVRSKEQILRTLDKNARLNAMPFMPQMFQYCGKRFKVLKRAHKTCDTIKINRDYPVEALPTGFIWICAATDGPMAGAKPRA